MKVRPFLVSTQPHFQRMLHSKKLARNERKSLFLIQNVLLSNFKVKIQNKRIKTVSVANFSSIRQTLGPKLKNGRILGLLGIRFDPDIILTSQLLHQEQNCFL